MRAYQQSRHNESVISSSIRSDSKHANRDNALYVLGKNPDISKLIQILNGARTHKKQQKHEMVNASIDRVLQIVYLQSSALGKNNKDVTGRGHLTAKSFTRELQSRKRLVGMMYLLSEEQMRSEKVLIKNLGLSQKSSQTLQNLINLQIGDFLKTMIESIINEEKADNFKNLKIQSLPFILFTSFQQTPDGGQKIRELFQTCLDSIYQSHEETVKKKIPLEDYRKIVSYVIFHPSNIGQKIEKKLSQAHEEEPEDIGNLQISQIESSVQEEENLVKLEFSQKKILPEIPNRKKYRQNDETGIGSEVVETRNKQEQLKEHKFCSCKLI